MRSGRWLIVKTGDALPSVIDERGSYDDWIAAGMGLPRRDVEVATVYEGAALPDPAAPIGAVVTGSSAFVTEAAPWSERTGAWLRRAVEAGTPVLGVCYGHQLLARALGGEVGRNPRGREIGTVLVRLEAAASDDPLLAGFPPTLRVQATHLESVLSLPPEARLLASSDLDPHAAFAVGERAFGVQFHPEFDADVIREYIRARREPMREEGLSPDALLAAAVDSPYGTALLRRFRELAESG